MSKEIDQIQWVKIASIKRNPDNPRVIKDADFYELVESIRGFPKMMKLNPIKVNKDMMILSGNQRFKAVQELGWEEVPVQVATELETEKEQKQFIIRDNTHAGSFDADLLANHYDMDELGDWLPQDELQKMGLSDEDLDVMSGDHEEEEEKAQDLDKMQIDIKQGDLIQLGDHRLLCGDATSREDVTKLLAGEQCDMVFTDPPYGVNVQGGKQKSNIAGDLTQTAIPFSFELAVEVATVWNARFYFCGGEGNIGLYAKLFERYLAQMPRHLIWVKNGFVMKQNGYHNQYEIIFYGYKKGGGGQKAWFGGRTEDEASDVWKVDRDPTSSYLHPTQKPIELAERAIKNHTEKGMLVYEPFAGSGSTMLACERNGRKCLALELDPKYCQVIINRFRNKWEHFPITINGENYE